MLKNNKKFVVANWKMNFFQNEAIDFCRKLALLDPKLREKLIIAPSEIYLGLINYLFPDFSLAAQDISMQKFTGAFTGESSSQMIASNGVKYAIIGHYERRIFANEKSAQIIQKAKNSLDAGITPIVCFGEEKQGDDLLLALDEVYLANLNIIYAYEPYWAIGTNHIDLEVISSNIKKVINKQNTIKLMYGGSVNSQNIVQLSTIQGIAGFLVGSASLNFDHLLQILKSI